MESQPQPTREQFVKSLFVLEVQDNIHNGADARSKLVSGINKGADAVKVSYGASGANALIQEDIYPFSRTTNDGKLILKDILLADSVETIGLNLLREVADKSDRESGDGRKTSVILTQAIINEGMKIEASPMEIKRSLDECLPYVLDCIDAQTKQITPETVGTIASVASESEFLGQIYQDIYSEIGKDGIVELDNSGLPDTSYEITEGVRLLNCGFHYPYMANEDKGRKAVYNYPKILITKQKIATIDEMDRIFRSLAKEGRDELVIFCDDIDPKVSGAMAYLHHGTTPQGKPIQPFKSLVIKAPTLWKDWIYEDFAKITGATVINPSEGVSLKNMQLSHLGTCDKIVTSKDETIVLPSKYVDYKQHTEKLKEDNSDEAKIRLARLQTKTAILKLGANSETELSYIRGKALDARNASFLALQGGVVNGGGCALRDCALLMSKTSEPISSTIGATILSQALRYPFDQIKENMGMKGAKFDKFHFQGILDPATVVKNSITNAISVASTVLTTNVVITKPKV